MDDGDVAGEEEDRINVTVEGLEFGIDRRNGEDDETKKVVAIGPFLPILLVKLFYWADA